MSLCSRRRCDSAVSTGNANVGELNVLESSVGGVETRDRCDEAEMLGDDCAWEGATSSDG